MNTQLHFYIFEHLNTCRAEKNHKQTITQYENTKPKKKENRNPNIQKMFIFMRTKHFFFRVKKHEFNSQRVFAE